MLVGGMTSKLCHGPRHRIILHYKLDLFAISMFGCDYEAGTTFVETLLIVVFI